MRKLTILILMVLFLIIPVNATQVEDWPMGKSNIMPEGLTGIMYDFEEGSNCGLFRNLHIDYATFEFVPSLQAYMSDYLPSYVAIGGSMCGTQRCYMNIYPYDNQMDWIYIVNGRSAFSPIICCESMECVGGMWPGECIPAQKAAIEFTGGINYVSFLASTGNDLRIRLYDTKGNQIHYSTISVTYERTDGNPSNFTQFTYHSNVDIGRMELNGPYNAWHIDDFIVGNLFIEPKPTPEKTPKPNPKPTPAPVDYTYVTELAKQLIDVEYLEYGLGFDYETSGYAVVDKFSFPEEMEYYNTETKEFDYGTGISDEGLILWAYNQNVDMLGQNIVMWSTAANMRKHDFKEVVANDDIKAGDVFFLDDDLDGVVDTVGMVVERESGMDLMYASEIYGVSYFDHETMETNPEFVGYRRLPNKINGGHNPIPKGN